MDYQSDDIERAYHNLIAAKEILFEAMEHEIEAIESFENARKKAILEQPEEDKSSRDVKEARLLDKIGNEYREMLQANKDQRMASYDHEIAKTTMQFFRDLMDWQKAGEKSASDFIRNPLRLHARKHLRYPARRLGRKIVIKPARNEV